MTIITKNLFIIAAVIAPFFIFSVSGEGPRLGWVSTAFADVQGQNVNFIVNTGFDKFGRSNITATLRHIGENAYFYADDDYWGNLNTLERQEFLAGVSDLASEFDVNIYPVQTTFWGQEAKPGVDGDNRITILLEQLKSGNGGYFSTGNGYSKGIAPESNEREMLAISAESVKGSFVKVFLAHEFEHLISFNQKELLRDIEEEVWLNELRAEYSTTLVGYNGVFSGSNLERRVDTFFDDPSDSLVEWPNVSRDYSLAALLGEYIAEEYGKGLLKESLQSNLIGIPSLDAALARRLPAQAGGETDRFLNIFANWLIATYVNDESQDPRFGYARAELTNRQASPQRITILGPSGSHVFDYFLKPWQPYGHKFHINGLAGDKVAKLSPGLNFKYAYFDNLGRMEILDKDFYVDNPGGLEYFYIFPVNSTKTLGFGTYETGSSGRLTVSFEDKTLGMEFGSMLKDGALIKKARESEVYVIEGKYKRYLRPEIIALYGHLDASKAIEVDEATFHSYSTANYVRYVDDERVYAVWPDGTKHWLNITPSVWDASGRDWGAIFIINDLELNNYQTGPDIIR